MSIDFEKIKEKPEKQYKIEGTIILNYRDTVQSQKSEIESQKRKINELNNVVSKLNTEINELSEKIGNVKTEINELVQQREEFRGQAGDHHKRYINLLSEIRNIKDELTRLEFLAKASKLAVVVEKRREKMRKRAEEIYEKYKRGGTLTLDEFKLLMEFGFIR